MRTLFIEYFYLKGNQGAIYAAKTHINLFAELSEQMTLIYPYKEGREPEHIHTKNVEMVPIADMRSKLSKFIGLCFGKMHRYKLASSYFDSKKYDTVVFDSSAVSARLIKRFRNAGIRTITIHHNYQIELLKGDCNKLLLLPSLFWTWIYERMSVRCSDLNITLTTQDKMLLKRHYSLSATFAVLGVFDYQQRDYPAVADKQRGHNYIITGGLAAKQNEDSIIPWLSRYYPKLREFDKDAKLTIAGRAPSKRLIEAIVQSGAEVIPSPTDMTPILMSGDYYLCPTDRGGGLKLRIMDGLKGGMLVLAHSVSARGYEKMQEEGLVYSYNDEATFIEALRKMRESNMSRSEIQGRYIEHYSFEAGVNKMREICVKHGFINERV